MALDPTQITKEHVLQAIAKIEEQNIALIPATRFQVIINGKPYPPKEVMRYAREELDGERTWEYSGGIATNSFLERLGFEVRNKHGVDDPFLEIIQRYKDHIRKTQLEDELYKWRLIKKQKGRPDVDAADIKSEVLNVKFSNLVYQIAPRVAKHIVEERPEEYREALRNLFNEQADLGQRMKAFEDEVLRIYAQIRDKESFGTYHDERTISAILTIKYPERYTFYKDSFYRKLCGLLGVSSAKAGGKFVHYLELVRSFVDDYVEGDAELLELVHSFHTEDCYSDPAHLVVAQDILYQMLDKASDVSYWVFQANPNHYDLAGGLRAGEGIDTWTVTKHLKNIKAGDKVILWSTGPQAGCYALAEVTQEPVDIDGTYVAGIEVTDNLVDRPLLQPRIRSTPGLENLKAGTQGTVFSATQKQYETIRGLIGQNDKAASGPRRYWLYAPGEGASRWDEFYDDGIAALGWEELGDLSQYQSQEEIAKRLREIGETDSAKTNDSLANFEFLKVMKIGDIIIPKQGRTSYLGYGVVESDYFYDDSQERFKSRRKVEWKKKGTWIDEHGEIVLKTLTDITNFGTTVPGYKGYVDRLCKLIGIEQEPEGVTSPVMGRTNMSLNQILYGPPGTGKTYNSIDRAVKIVDGDDESRTHEDSKKRFDELRRLGQIEFITFHQNYGYEDFVVGISPDVTAGSLRFDRREGIFKQLADKATTNWKAANDSADTLPDFNRAFSALFDPLIQEEISEIDIPMTRPGYSFKIKNVDLEEGKIRNFIKQSGGSSHDLTIKNIKAIYEGNKEYGIEGLGIYYHALDRKLKEVAKTLSPSQPTDKRLKNFVLIIDEINRANISKVFGELITLLEDDKRLGAKNELKVTLPNGDQNFGIPPNLYLIGTMNTADKSIALVDIALRRRFDFVGFYPRPDKLEDPGAVDLLKAINDRIYKKKNDSADYLIGHAYFMTGAPIKAVLEKKVIPLLSEYFAGRQEIISEIFKGTGWTASYDTDRFEWDISQD